jgi:hypothetical protein
VLFVAVRNEIAVAAFNLDVPPPKMILLSLDDEDAKNSATGSSAVS